MSEDAGLAEIRLKLLELQKGGAFTPDSFGTYEQTVLQLHQECERRKQSLLAHANTLSEQIKAAQAQAAAFTVVASLLYNVVNGFVEAEKRRLHEETARAAGVTGKPVSASGMPYEKPPLPPVVATKKLGRPRKN